MYVDDALPSLTIELTSDARFSEKKKVHPAYFIKFQPASAGLHMLAKPAWGGLGGQSPPIKGGSGGASPRKNFWIWSRLGGLQPA